jgi:two-component system, chemotaxis family, sensor kinase CheA
MTTPDFLEIFRDEADERLDRIVDTLLALEAGRAPADAVDSLFRDAHTIKGAAGMLGLEQVQELARAVEDVLEDLRTAGEFPRELTDPLLRAADALRRHVRGAEEPTEALLDELARSGVQAPGAEPPDAGPEELPEPAAAPGAEPRSIRVAAEKLDRLLDLVGETVLHRRRLEHALRGRAAESEAIADELDTGERLLGELQETAIRMRTLPLASITGPFPRAARDLAAAENKEVELVIAGAETELDRVILEGLSEPLVHLLRNAIAHGIERPQEREDAGKPRAGRIELRAEQRGRQIAVTVADDGRGITEDVVRAARESGASVLEVLTAPGFSTSEQVTDLSGRGVGLDVVRMHVESLGGSLEISGQTGRGLRVTLLLPLTLALLDVLIVERAGQSFGIPLTAVEEVADAAGSESFRLSDLAGLVGIEGAPEPRPRAPTVVVSASGARVAAVCDRLVEEQEVVVKSLGPLLAAVPGYLGGAILEDGSVALLLDPAALVRAGERTERPEPHPEHAVEAVARILVVEDSFTMRELQKNILEAAGHRVETARDGEEALGRLAIDDEIGVVVTDVEMPGMDGLELVRAIRENPAWSSLPVIIVSTRGSDEDRQRGLEAGADVYIAKAGFSQSVLVEAVRDVLAERE